MQMRRAIEVLCGVALLLSATVARATAIYYIYADQIDTPRVIVRPSDNQVVWRWDGADPFGASQPNSSPAGVGPFVYNLRFPGQLYDAETATHYNYFRSYDPGIGRYVQSDPIGLKGGIDTYLYVNDPLRFIDPQGLMGAGGGGASGGHGGTGVLPFWVNPGYVDTTQNDCATAECAAGLPPDRSPLLTPDQLERGMCRLECNIVGFPVVTACNLAAGGGLPGMVVGQVVKITVCDLVCP